MSGLDRCGSCGKLAYSDDVVPITATEYEALKAAAVSASTRKSISSYRAVSRSGIARKPELADFILDCAVTMTVAEITTACVAKFGSNAPSRSSVFRFVRQMKDNR